MVPNESYTSPTGKFTFRVVAWEARMSHWIESFTLVDAATGRIVWHMDDPNWSLDQAKWISDSVVEVSIRKYPGDHTPPSFEVTIDCDARTAAVMGGPPMPLDRAELHLEQLYRRGRYG
jgi:hypothetical protein